MPASPGQALLGGYLSSAGTVMTLSVGGPKAVTLGQKIYVFTNQDSSGSVSSCVDDLGHVYTKLFEDSAPSSSRQLTLLVTEVTNPGDLDVITVTFSVSIVSAAGVSVSFNDVDDVLVGSSLTNDNTAATDPNGTSVAGDGLHFFLVGDHKFVLFGNPPVPTFTPPAGYTTFMEYGYQDGSSIYRYARLAYKIGTEVGGAISGDLNANNPWSAVSAGVAAINERPETVGGYSFDGVTVRAN